MLNRLRDLANDLRGSLWFLPGVIVLGFIALALVLLQVDSRIAADTLRQWPRLFGAGAEGSRGMLSAIASSVITVTGVAFSITVVTLTLASSQYSSRVLRQFMRDRVNQGVLGILAGTFAYCLLVLGTIRDDDRHGGFVPSVATFVAVVLAFFAIGALIYFIHHVALSIQASQLLASVAEEARATLDHLYPDEGGDMSGAGEDRNLDFREVAAPASGYLQRVDLDGQLGWARRHEAVVRLEQAVGQFVVEGVPLVSVRAQPMRPPVNDEAVESLLETFTLNTQRSMDQDLSYGIRQIVDVALKALSPGINDTTTAVMAVDHLTSLLARLVGRRMAPPERRDEAGVPRVQGRAPRFADLLDEAFEQIRQAAAGNVAVLRRMLEACALLGGWAKDPGRRQAVLRHVRALGEMAERTIPAVADRAQVVDQARTLVRHLEHPGAEQASRTASPLPPKQAE